MEALHDWFVSRIFGIVLTAPFLILFAVTVLLYTKDPTPKNKKIRRELYIWLGAIVVFFYL